MLRLEFQYIKCVISVGSVYQPNDKGDADDDNGDDSDEDNGR